jgi:hypothetical protein
MRKGMTKQHVWPANITSKHHQQTSPANITSKHHQQTSPANIASKHRQQTSPANINTHLHHHTLITITHSSSLRR